MGNMVKLDSGRHETEAGSEIFSSYLSRLEAAEEPPDQQVFEEVIVHLRRALAAELRRRGLWTLPPTYLGVQGVSWMEDGGAPLEELVLDLYCYIFIDRLHGLLSRHRLGRDLRGLVLLNIRHFVYECRKTSDPIGYQVFDRLRAAVSLAIERGDLFVAEGGAMGSKVRLTNSTVLSFHGKSGPLASTAALKEHALRWNDELLPELVAAQSRAVPGVVQRLSSLISSLEDAGVPTFRFGDLLTPMKDDVRRRWTSLLDGSLGEVATEAGDSAVRARIALPEEEPYQHHKLASLLEEISDSVARVSDPKTRMQLWRLWSAIRNIAAEDGRRPSNVKLSRHLGIPRERLPGLLDHLGRLTLRSLEGSGGRPREGNVPRERLLEISRRQLEYSGSQLEPPSWEQLR